MKAARKNRWSSPRIKYNNTKNSRMYLAMIRNACCSFSVSLLDAESIGLTQNIWIAARHPRIEKETLQLLSTTDFANHRDPERSKTDKQMQLFGDCRWNPPLNFLMVKKGISMTIPSLTNPNIAPSTMTKNNGAMLNSSIYVAYENNSSWFCEMAPASRSHFTIRFDMLLIILLCCIFQVLLYHQYISLSGFHIPKAPECSLSAEKKLWFSCTYLSLLTRFSQRHNETTA